MKQLLAVCSGLLGLFAVQSVLGHATVWPRESIADTFEKYTIRIPNEKESATVRVEAEFPANVAVNYFEARLGWTIEHHRNADGRIIGATWNGGSIGPNEFAEFAVIGRNPEAVATLVWKVVQVYADGSRSEWVGEPRSQYPAPITTVKLPNRGHGSLP